MIRIRIRNPDPYWSPTSNSGSGSGKNEYGSTTLQARALIIIFLHLKRVIISNCIFAFYDEHLMSCCNLHFPSGLDFKNIGK
jgi:hypothetical protein